MSEIMLHGVLNMPPELWNNDSPIDVMQRHSRYVQASKYIDELEADLTAAREELVETRKDFMCLAELLDGHDATECRMNLVRLKEQRDRLADLVKQFIYILDITEESDSGRLFHPTNITSCRAGDLQKIGELVEALRRASRTTNQNEL
jgi:hypothetical protein